jgi:hypothetical protein
VARDYWRRLTSEREPPAPVKKRERAVEREASLDRVRTVGWNRRVYVYIINL